MTAKTPDEQRIHSFKLAAFKLEATARLKALGKEAALGEFSSGGRHFIMKSAPNDPVGNRVALLQVASEMTVDLCHHHWMRDRYRYDVVLEADSYEPPVVAAPSPPLQAVMTVIECTHPPEALVVGELFHSFYEQEILTMSVSATGDERKAAATRYAERRAAYVRMGLDQWLLAIIETSAKHFARNRATRPAVYDSVEVQKNGAIKEKPEVTVLRSNTPVAGPIKASS